MFVLSSSTVTCLPCLQVVNFCRTLDQDLTSVIHFTCRMIQPVEADLGKKVPSFVILGWIFCSESEG